MKASHFITPTKLMEKAAQEIAEPRRSTFLNMVKTAVNLQARNTKNLASQDLARHQVATLAQQYGVKIEWTN